MTEIIEKGGFKYLDSGSGNTVVLLHGLFGDLSNFERLIDIMSKKYRVVMPILPLYTCEIKNANLNGLVKFFSSFVEHLGLKNFTMLGNSLGGHVALLYELIQPQLTKGIVLTGSSGLFENSFGSNYPRKNKEFVRKKVQETFGNKELATDELVDMVYKVITTPASLIRTIKIAKSATRENLNDELSKIKKSTLLIWGKDDVITPPFVAEQFNEKIEGSELEFIENCGHAPMMEYPDKFCNLLKDFLAKIY